MVGILAFLAGPIGRWLVLAALVMASYGAAYWKGRQAGSDAAERQYAAAQAEAARQAAIIAAKRHQVTEKVVIQYRDRVRTVREKGDEIVRTVEKFVPVGTCDLPGGVRLLHDAGAAGRPIPDTASGIDAAGVTVATFAATVIGNYTTCHETETRLTALQQWVRDQAAVAPGPAKPDQ